MNGKMLAHYEILSLLGKGGMGEVYRARDTRLDREVALKLLHDDVARDPERLARFRREAKLLASLSHPNIATLHGIEEFDGRVFLVMELAAGRDLTDLISEGPIPADEMTRIAAQIARGLEAAHERGIVHRDLKPSNIKVSTDGQAKILDFGLARVYSDDDGKPGDIENSPTITAAFTAAGVILGTAAYMSPEQARGRTVDKRTDIWAFGVILWEMMTGERLFAGETVSDTLAAVLTREIDPVQLPASTPPSLRLLVQRCLERDPKRRLRDIGEARLMLEDPDASSILLAPAISGAARARNWMQFVPWILLVGLAAFALPRFLGGDEAPSRAKPVRRFEIEADLPAIYNTRAVQISPDGKLLAICARDGLWVRPLDDPKPRLLVPPEELEFDETGITPFWSPDSREIGYGSKGRMWKVAADGGRPSVICTLPGEWMGGAWGADGTILFGTGRGPMYEVSARGGDARLVLEPESGVELDFHQPSYVVDGGGFLYSVHRSQAVDTLELYRDGKRKVLLRIEEDVRDNAQLVNNPVYSRTGHILYQRDQGNVGLWAVPFDPMRGEVTGTPFLVESEQGYPSVSDDGTLVHMALQRDASGRLIIVSRSGQVLEELTELQPLTDHPRFSADGRRIVAEARRSGSTDIFVLDRDSGALNWLTLSSTNDWGPVWMPGGARIAYASPGPDGDCLGIWALNADGSGEPEFLAEKANTPTFTSDGANLVAATMCRGERGIIHVRLDGSEQPRILAQDPAGVDQPEFSPDGRYIAYRSWKGGMVTLEVADFPAMTGRRLIGRAESAIRWSRSGDELFYTSAQQSALVSAKLQAGTGFAIESTEPLFDLSRLDVNPFGPFDVSPDGNEFVFVQGDPEARAISSFTVVENWFEEFREQGAPR